MVNFSFVLPSGEEVKRALRLAKASPEELTDRELWILDEFGGGLQ